MFGFLKKAVGNFVEKITGKVEKEEAQQPAKVEEAKKQEPVAESIEEKILQEAQLEVDKRKEEPRRAPEPQPKLQPEPAEEKVFEEEDEAEEAEVKLKPVERKEKPFFEVKEEKKEFAPKVGILKKITGIFTGGIEIGEAEVAPLFDDLRIALLESDVSLDTSEFLIQDLRARLVGKKVSRGGVNDAVREEVKSALLDLFKQTKQLDLVQFAKSKKASGEPAIIMFLGPNGMGKTTTIAKLTKLLSDAGLTVVLAASDSFRSGAIHQLSIHGERLGARVIKRDYGADPTAVAFDAIAHAKAQKIDVVLIDTAGRQETNYNLIKEMEKMNRVLKPDLRIFVGESVAGHALVEQARKFNEAVGGIDGLILTKLDTDAKGGTAFSIAHDLGIPILFIGVGQEYADLKPFNAEWLVRNVLS